MAAVAVGFGTVQLAGCALNRLGSEEVTAALERQQADRAAAGESYARTPVPERVEAPGATRPAPRLEAPATLREFIVLALRDNPDIKAAEEAARARAARIPQVTALPDPMLATKTLPEPVRTAEGDNFFILGVSQRLPVPEKLDRAGRIALEETRMALQQLEQTRLRVIADVKRAYYQLYVIDKSIEITRDNQDLLVGLIDVARGQVAAGRRSQDDVLRAQVELSNLEAELIDLRQRRISSEAMLNTVLNRPPTTPIAAPQEFDIRRVDTKLEELFANGVEVNPELKQFERQIERDREAVKLARLAWWPDFTVGFEWMLMEPREAFQPPPNPMTGQRPVVSKMSEEGTDNWAITFGFNVPIWFDKIEAGIREASRKLAATMQEYTSARNMVYFRIDDALTRVQAQRELAAIFRDTIIPQAQQAYEVSRAAYTAGTSDFLFVIDNWQKWLTFTIQYHRALGELERSVADLEQAVGLSLNDIEVTP